MDTSTPCSSRPALPPRPSGTPNSPGVTEEAVQDTILCPFNDGKAVADALARFPGQVAAVILEPIAGNMGLVPPRPGYLATLRELTEKAGSLLVFDEVMTGFRVALRRRAGPLWHNARPDGTREDRRRRLAGRGLRGIGRDHGPCLTGRSDLPGRHAFREPAGHGSRPGNPAKTAATTLPTIVSKRCPPGSPKASTVPPPTPECRMSCSEPAAC